MQRRTAHPNLGRVGCFVLQRTTGKGFVMRVEIKVLGPLEVSVGGVSIVPTASKPTQLLAMLALNAGHVVTQAALTDEIWDYQPPRSGVPTLHTYILKLRRKLQDALAGEGDISA